MERRLAAILAADVAGYTRLMGADEVGTLARLTALRETVLAPLVGGHGGRVVKLMGDGVLVEFASVVNALECALAWQEAVAGHEAPRPPDSRILFRIGVNLGDVIVEGEDIHGDGVNVAARLEALAEPGGICLSGDAWRQVRGRVEAGFEDMGERRLKNVAEPVQVFRIAAAAPVAPAVQPSPDKPSIAVLPFANLSSDPDQAFFADGMTEDLIAALSRMPWFFVIARNTAFAYRERAADVAQIAAELGVKYVLEGSVRKSGSRLRITAQLVDAGSGQHVWAERYDRETADIFDIQDEVTEAIVGALVPEFLAIEARRARRKDPAQLDAWECLMRGRAHLWKLGREDTVEARALFERAMALDPQHALGAGDLAIVHLHDAYYRWSDDPEGSLRLMIDTARRAVEADDTDPWALTTFAWASIFAHDWDEALAAVERAIELSPSFAPAIGVRGTVYALCGEPERAVEAFARATRLSPRDGMMGFWLMGLYWAHHHAGRHAEAEAAARHGIRLAPGNPTFRRQLTAALAAQGRLDEARAAVAEYLHLAPDHTTADAAKVPCRDPQVVARFVEALRQAGLPDPA